MLVATSLAPLHFNHAHPVNMTCAGRILGIALLWLWVRSHWCRMAELLGCSFFTFWWYRWIYQPHLLLLASSPIEYAWPWFTMMRPCKSLLINRDSPTILDQKPSAKLNTFKQSFLTIAVMVPPHLPSSPPIGPVQLSVGPPTTERVTLKALAAIGNRPWWSMNWDFR